MSSENALKGGAAKRQVQLEQMFSGFHINAVSHELNEITIHQIAQFGKELQDDMLHLISSDSPGIWPFKQ